jgi:hypothetical protein
MQGRQRATVLMSAVALVVTLAGQAQGARVATRDAGSDVWSPEGSEYVAAGSVANTDLLRTSVNHREHRIVGHARYEALTKNASHELRLNTQVKTNKGKVYDVIVMVDPNGEGDRLLLFRRWRDNPIECDHAVGTAAWSEEKISFSVPRACLGSPRWVKYRAVARSYKEETGLFLDMANHSGPTKNPWSARVRRD